MNAISFIQDAAKQILDKDRDSIHGATDAQYKNHDNAQRWRVFLESRALRSTDFPASCLNSATGL